MMETMTINGETWTKTETTDDIVLVRSRDSGVHVGMIKERNGDEVTLLSARRIWRWRGANTLNEVATKGIQDCSNGYTRVSDSVSQITILGVCEIIPMTKTAYDSVANAGWAK